MRLSTWKKRRWMRRLALGFAVAAIVAPTAQATHLDSSVQHPAAAAAERAHPRGGLPCAPNCPGTLESAQPTHPRGNPAIGSTRIDIPVPQQQRGNPDVASTLEVRTPVVVHTIEDDAFDYGDAAIGGGIALGAMLLAGAAFYGNRNRGHLARA
jgi:hypothetical protein